MTALRVTTSGATRLPDDPAIDVEPAASGPAATEPVRQKARGEGQPRAVIGADSRATATRPRTIEVVVDGWRFELEVETVRRAEIRQRATRGGGAAVGSGPIEIRAMIPGRVVSVAVAVGDRVEAGQTILVIEAMKMQNDLRAPHAGTIERLTVGAGETITLGQVLGVLGVGP